MGTKDEIKKLTEENRLQRNRANDFQDLYHEESDAHLETLSRIVDLTEAARKAEVKIRILGIEREALSKIVKALSLRILQNEGHGVDGFEEDAVSLFVPLELLDADHANDEYPATSLRVDMKIDGAELVFTPTEEPETVLQVVVMAPPDEERCPVCNAKTVEYKMGLTKRLVGSLAKCYHQHGLEPFHLSSTITHYSDRDNFTKLKHWGLVKTVKGATAERTGIWQVTMAGKDFVQDRLALPKYLWTYRGSFVRFEPGQSVLFSSIVDDPHQSNLTYASEAEPHG